MGEEGKWLKEDIKQTKISVEGADVEITKVVLHWNNRPRRHHHECRSREVREDKRLRRTLQDTRRRLMSVTVQYKILNDAPTATIKVWGYD